MDRGTEGGRRGVTNRAAASRQTPPGQASIATAQPGRLRVVGLLSIYRFGDLAGDHIRSAPDGIDVKVRVSLRGTGLSVSKQLADDGQPEAGAGSYTGE